jgi:hypothetical protein
VSAPVLADARTALLSRLIDHAPTFPPASLAPAEALLEDGRARASGASFLLARLVWPASRLTLLGDEERAISLVLDAPYAGDDPRVEAVEIRGDADVDALAAIAPEVYVELPVDDELERALGRLAELGLRAKVRCGGPAVPTVAELARFVRGCRAAGVVFKATAGLHHAIRRNGGHGFLNLLAAVVFGDEEEALAETDIVAFALDADAFRWRGRVAGPDELAQARRHRFHSIGSCSFFEPVEELESLGAL